VSATEFGSGAWWNETGSTGESEDSDAATDTEELADALEGYQDLLGTVGDAQTPGGETEPTDYMSEEEYRERLQELATDTNAVTQFTGYNFPDLTDAESVYNYATPDPSEVEAYWNQATPNIDLSDIERTWNQNTPNVNLTPEWFDWILNHQEEAAIGLVIVLALWLVRPYASGAATAADVAT